MRVIASINSSIDELSLNINKILYNDIKFYQRHVRYNSQKNILYFHTGISRIFHGCEDRQLKRQAGTDHIKFFFYNLFPPQYSYLRDQFMKRIPLLVKGGNLKYLCDIFKRTYRPYIKKFRRNYGFVLNEMYQVYLANDVIVLGGNHSEKNSRAHACLRDFLKFLHIKKGVMNFRNHAIFYEAELSMYSHYRRRAFSDYSSEDNFRFKYNPDYKNPNTLNQYVDVISKKKLEYEKVNWFNNYGIRMFFYDDRITDSKITPPNLIIGDPLFTREQFEKDLVTIKKMCNINEIPGNIQKRKNGFTTCLELRQRLHYFMAGRIAHEICRTPKSFVPIGSAHVRTSISSDGKTIPPIQYYLKEYLRSYGKKVFTLKFIEKDMPSFDRVRDKYVDATISWPAWIS